MNQKGEKEGDRNRRRDKDRQDNPETQADVNQKQQRLSWRDRRGRDRSVGRRACERQAWHSEGCACVSMPGLSDRGYKVKPEAASAVPRKESLDWASRR